MRIKGAWVDVVPVDRLRETALGVKVRVEVAAERVADLAEDVDAGVASAVDSGVQTPVEPCLGALEQPASRASNTRGARILMGIGLPESMTMLELCLSSP